MEPIKYTTLYKLAGQYHCDDSPILVEAGALLKNEKTNRLMIQLKMKNISAMEISACKVWFQIKDSFGSEIETIAEHSYIDLHAKSGESFGSSIPVYVSKEEARTFEIAVVEIAFVNGKKWDGERKAWPMISSPKSIDDYFEDQQLAKQFEIEVGESNRYVPEVRGSLFFCCCGDVRLENIDKCAVCGRSKKELLSIVNDSDGLRLRAEERLKLEAEERKEKERLEEELRQKKEQNKERLIKAIKVVVPIIAILGLIIILVVKIAMPEMERSNHYKEAYSLLQQEQFDEAAKEFSLLGDYKDSAQMVNECTYQKAASFAQNNKYKEAITLYNSIIDYSDSKDKITETEDLWKGDDYRDAVSLYETGEKEKAIKAFEKLDEYKDSKEKVKEISYSLGLDKLNSQDYKGAISIFKKIPDYKDAETQRKKAQYLYAQELFEKEQYYEANLLFAEIDDYEDSADMAKESNYNLAQQYLEEEKFKEAIALFEKLGNYNDSQDQLLEAKYLYCTNNLTVSDSTTKEYLAELSDLQYKDAEEMNERLYKWGVDITTELISTLGLRYEFKIVAKIVTGPENAKTGIKFEFIMPNGDSDTVIDDEEYAVGDEPDSYVTLDMMIVSYDILETPFRINVYDDSGNKIGTYYDVVPKPSWYD